MTRATIWALAASLSIGTLALAQQAVPPGEAVDEAKDRKVMERFLTVLEKTPRRGTALDRVYGYHVERGTLDAFLKTYRDKVAADPNDGSSWLVLGLVEAQRGKDAAAVEAFRKAEAARPDDPLPSYYLGQAQILVGQPDAAADSFERALVRKPARADLLDIYQALGRVHQRAHRNDRALAVWDRLEKAFPDDPRVQEQIAHALADESQDAAALTRFETLAKGTKDRFRQVQFALEAAELKVRLGKSSDALADFEGLLGKLDPESWLYREVRRKVEDVFLRTDDLAGLANYYDRWIKKVPDDVEAMSRLGRTLANQGRVADARKWFDQAVKLAPSRRELRLALIEQLTQERNYTEAAAQYEALAKLEPNNPDVVRDWGRMLLRDGSKPEPDRKKAAAAVWKRLAPDDAKDAVSIAQAADLYRQAGLSDDAIALYQRAIKLAPEASQYREYLGEYYHVLKRPADALSTWRQSVEGSKRNAKTLGRLGEVLAGFGYRNEAVEPMVEACKLEPDDFDLRLRLADLRLTLEQPAEALVELDKAATVAGADEQAEAVLDRQIKAYQASNTLGARIETLQKEVEAKPTALGWTRLARLLEADGKPPEAARAIVEATKIDPKSVPAWVATARLRELAGDLLGSVQTLRTLTTIDRRSRTDYLMGIAKLESRLGRRIPALEAGRELLAAAPGNADNHQFFAELCFSLGEPDEGLDSLRRAARANPSDPKAMLTLAENLARQFRTEEAIELYWRAFAKTLEVDGKLSIVARLADQYLQRNQLDRLFSRLERELREPNQSRELSLCLAQAHAASGDFATARLELERLLATSPRDIHLLGQLSSMAEQEGDFLTAAKYQKQAVDIASSTEGIARLAQLYVRSGEYLEAEAIWTKSTEGQDPGRSLTAIDSLLANGKRDAVLQVTSRLLRDRPNDWELLYREGIALAGLNRADEADQRFRAILALKGSDDDKSVLTRSKGPGNQNRAAGTPASTGTNPARVPNLPIQDRVRAASQAAMVSGVTNNNNINNGMIVTPFIPQDAGQGRIGALAWQYSLAQRVNAHEAFVKKLREDRDKAANDPRVLWDWYYLQAIKQDYAEMAAAGLALVKRLPTDLPAQYVYLNSMGNRAIVLNQVQVYRPPGSTAPDPVPALPPEEVDRMMASYQGLKGRRPDLAPAMLGTVLIELKRANRTKEADVAYREAMDNAAPGSLYATTLLSLAAERGDVDGLAVYLDKLEHAPTAGIVTGPGTTTPAMIAQVYARSIALRGATKAYPEMLAILDRFLTWNTNSRSRPKSTAPAQPNAPRVNNVINYVITYWTTAQTSRNIGVDFPSPGDRIGIPALNVLRTAFEFFRKDDAFGDLASHLQTKADEASGPEKVDRLLALGVLRWWNDEKDEATLTLTEAAQLAGPDASVRMMLAQLHELRNDLAEALAVIDGIDSVDTATVQKRENQALRLAVATGNIERARIAAERLFGLRLDAEAQVNLASLMHQLGMHDLAEAVLARARKTAGNKPPALLTLMNQYQKQDKPELALQLALQILRLRPSASTANYQATMNANGYIQNQANTEEDYARQQAIQILSRSGKLKELIARAEGQLERSPNSMTVLQSLAEYARVANDKEKTKALYERMAKTRPDDAKLRLQVANLLVQAGEPAAAMEHYRAAIKADPATIATYFNAMLNAFRQAGKSDEFAAIVEGIDLRAVGNTQSLMNITQYLTNDPATKNRAQNLFRRIWVTFPGDRPMFLSYLNNNEEWWRLPEIYSYAKELVLPAPGATNVPPWSGVDRVQYYGNDGRVFTLANRLIDTAAGQNRLDEFAREVREAQAKHPEWLGGKALLAVVLLRLEKYDEARSIVKEILAETKETPPITIRIFIGQELEDHSPVQDLAGEVYEVAAREYAAKPVNDFNNNMNPSMKLLAWYRSAGRMDECRDLMIKLARTRVENSPYDPSYVESQRLNSMTNYAQQLTGMGFPADAIALYRELLVGVEAMASDSMGMQYINKDWMIQNAQQGIRQSLMNAKPEMLSPAIAALFRPVPGASKAGPTVDLFLNIPSNDFEKATITSTLAEAFEKLVGKKPGTATSSASDKEIVSSLATLLEKNPDDMAVNVAVVLYAFAEGKPEEIDKATTRLLTLVEKMPLEEIKPSKASRGKLPRPNTRQRAEALKQVDLWLVARSCWTQDATRSKGDLFATRAVEAARRQADTRWPAIMLRDWGQSALDRGDRATAERRWTELLELVIPPIESTRADASDRPKATLVGFAPPKPATIPATPKEEFDKAMILARMAADRKMIPLSIRAVREAFRGGAPVGVQPGLDASNTMAVNNAQNAYVTTRVVNGVIRNVRTSNVQDGVVDPTLGQIQASLFQLETLWSREGAAPREIYEVLRDIVLPPTRPSDVNLYAAPLLQNAPRHPRSTGLRLAVNAVKLGATAELREAAKARRGNPIAELSAMVLLAQIGLEAHDVPSTVAALDQIEIRLRKDSLKVSAELAAVAALPALGVEGISKSAETVIGQTIANLTPQAGIQPIGTFALVLAGIELDHGRIDEAKKRYQTYLDSQDKNVNQNDPAFIAFRKRTNLIRVASEYAGRGLVADGLDLLGRFADVGATRYQEVAPNATVALIARGLAALPAEERYRLLLPWTMPTADRKSVRLLTITLPESNPPAVFEKLGGTRSGGVFSNLGLLIDAAKQSGKLDELAAEARKLDGEKVEEAKILLILAEIARGRSAEVRPMVEALADELGKPEAIGPNGLVSRPTGCFLVARGSMADGALHFSGVRLAEALQARLAGQNIQYVSPQSAMLAQLKRDIVESRASRAAGRTWPIGRDPGLASWVPADSSRGTSPFTALIPPAWSEHEGHVALFSPSEFDSLAFAYPLTGPFEVSVETAATAMNEGDTAIAFGGQVFGSRSNGNNQNRFGMQTFNPNVNRAYKFEGSNRITIRSDGAKLTCLVNGLMVSEEPDPSPTSPWLMLTGNGRAAWRMLELRGSPAIPREVHLSQGDRLESWAASAYTETVAPRTVVYAPGQDASMVDGYDWSSRDGLIRGRRVEDPSLGEDVQSRLAYARPILDGESITYEFLHEPGTTHVHPSLGRLAFLIENDGVKLHWMTENGGPDASGLKPGNTVEDPAGRLGTGPLPIKPNAWNTMKLTSAEGKILLELNGEPIYQRILASTDDRAFGLFHFKDRTAVRVRDVVLRGDWPTNLDAVRSAGLLARRKPSGDESESRAGHILVGEADLVRDAEVVLQRTRSMPAPARFDELSRWVLPGSTHPTFRLQGSFTPLDPAPVALVGEGTPPVPFGHSRVHVGGEPESPANDLVDVARQLGRLDDLATKVEAAKVDEPLDARGRLALLAMIRVAQGKEDEAVDVLNKLKDLGTTIQTTDADWSRWPELMATRAGILRPKVRAAAMATLPLVKARPDQVLNATDVWVRQVRHTRSIGEAADKNVPFGEDPGIAGWTMLTRGRAVTRGSGYPRSSWIARDGEWAHDSGAKGAMLLFKTPLRGNFEATCDLAISTGRETLLSYAGVQIQPTNGGQFLSTQVDDLAYGSINLSPPLEVKGDWVSWRLTVRDAKLTIALNDRMVYEKPIPIECDPWLAIYASWPDGGAAKNFKLTGNPTIPDRLRLSGTPEWTGWTATEYDESTNNQGNTWRKRGDEIVGPRAFVAQANTNDMISARTTTRMVSNGVVILPASPPMVSGTSLSVSKVSTTLPTAEPAATSSSLAARQESMLRYRRPIVDDGVIEYEFYYEPGKTMVHPSLDRLAFLINPDGVMLHRTTDAAHDRAGLEPGNETVEPTCRRGPTPLAIRPKAWNRLKFSVTGDTVAIAVNDVLVYERPIETTNQRSFGLFHYADETEARVRNVTYRGDWPKALPK